MTNAYRIIEFEHFGPAHRNIAKALLDYGMEPGKEEI